MTESTTQTTVVKDDLTKVSKPPREDPNRITKKERTDKQLANDRRLAQISIDRKTERVRMKEEEEKRKREMEKDTPLAKGEESIEPTSSMSLLLIGGGITAVIWLMLAIWYFFFRKKEDSVSTSFQERTSPIEAVDSD